MFPGVFSPQLTLKQVSSPEKSLWRHWKGKVLTLCHLGKDVILLLNRHFMGNVFVGSLLISFTKWMLDVFLQLSSVRTLWEAHLQIIPTVRTVAHCEEDGRHARRRRGLQDQPLMDGVSRKTNTLRTILSLFCDWNRFFYSHCTIATAHNEKST